MEDEFREGRLLTALHFHRERDSRLRKRLLDLRRQSGPLHCDACLCISPIADAEYSDAIFEAHHLRPLAELGSSRTRVGDLALLCASCHRLIHRLLSRRGQWIGLEDLRQLCS
jgi:5-methylcytosine-specific restriction protein A